jgi:hypothetical protein
MKKLKWMPLTSKDGEWVKDRDYSKDTDTFVNDRCFSIGDQSINIYIINPNDDNTFIKLWGREND